MECPAVCAPPQTRLEETPEASARCGSWCVPVPALAQASCMHSTAPLARSVSIIIGYHVACCERNSRVLWENASFTSPQSGLLLAMSESMVLDDATQPKSGSTPRQPSKISADGHLKLHVPGSHPVATPRRTASLRSQTSTVPPGLPSLRCP